MRARFIQVIGLLLILNASGCAKKPPDLSDIPPPKPPPGYSPPPAKGAGDTPAAPGAPNAAPKLPTPPAQGK